MNKNLLTLALCSALVTLPAHANEEEEEQPLWEATAGLGLSLTSGNTDTTSLTTNIQVIQYLEFWEMQYKFDGIKQKNEGQTTANNKNYAIKGQYKLQKENAFMFAEGKRLEDDFGPFAENNTISVGYGQRLYKSKDLLIRADIGPGYTRYKFNESGETDSSSIVHVAGNLKWKISKSADFTQSLIFDQQLSDDKNLLVVSQSTLGARINGSLKMTLDVKITNNSEVQPGKKETDTITSVNLVYSF